MLTEERRQAILERLRSDGKVVAAELSSSLAVSPDTVRRDLQELAEAGLLRRVHGGALPPAGAAPPPSGPRARAAPGPGPPPPATRPPPRDPPGGPRSPGPSPR